MMEAVEVVRGQFTGDEAFDAGRQFVLRIGKEPILVHKDVPGFLINRINFPAALEAMRLVEMGVAGIEDVDKGLRLASGRKMGIFETGDLVGLDVTHGALLAIYEETKDPRWYPLAVLRRRVQAGWLGRKTGRGGTSTARMGVGWDRRRLDRKVRRLRRSRWKREDGRWEMEAGKKEMEKINKRENDMNEPVIVSAVRTAVGRFGGSLKGVTDRALGALVIKAAMERAGLEPGQVEEVVFAQQYRTGGTAGQYGPAHLRGCGHPHPGA